MRSEKFIAFYDTDGEPILGAKGMTNYDKRIRDNGRIIASVKAVIPEGARFWRIRKTMLKSLINITQLFELPDNDS